MGDSRLGLSSSGYELSPTSGDAFGGGFVTAHGCIEACLGCDSLLSGTLGKWASSAVCWVFGGCILSGSACVESANTAPYANCENHFHKPKNKRWQANDGGVKTTFCLALYLDAFVGGIDLAICVALLNIASTERDTTSSLIRVYTEGEAWFMFGSWALNFQILPGEEPMHAKTCSADINKFWVSFNGDDQFYHLYGGSAPIDHSVGNLGNPDGSEVYTQNEADWRKVRHHAPPRASVCALVHECVRASIRTAYQSLHAHSLSTCIPCP